MYTGTRMVVVSGFQTLIERAAGWSARRRQRRARIEAGHDSWPLMYSSPGAISGSVRVPEAPISSATAPALRGKLPLRSPEAVPVPVPPKAAAAGASPEQSQSRFRYLKRYWALASLALLLIGGAGAIYGVNVLYGNTEASEQETGLGQVAELARSAGRWAFSLDADRLKAEQAQQLYQPVVIKQVEPKYPESARRAGVEGLVIVTYALDAYGRPKDLKVSKSVPLLDEAVLTALRQWQYTAPQKGSTAQIYRYNAQFVLRDLTAVASSSHEPLP